MRNDAYIILIAFGALIFGVVMASIAWAGITPLSLNGIIFFIGIAIMEVAIAVIAIVVFIALIRRIFK